MRSLRSALVPTLAVAVGLALAACEPATTPPTVPTTVSTTVTPTPLTIGGDEFHGTGLDASRWRAYSGTYGNAGGGSRHCLAPSNVTVADDVLRITSERTPTPCADGSVQPYRSGFIGSREAGRYYPLEGTFTVRAKVPHAQGIWPAVWLRHRNGAGVAEVDLLESFHAQAPGRVSQVLHLDGKVNVANRATFFESPTPTPGWHTFAVRIDRLDGDGDGREDDVRFDFSVDGRATHGHLDVDPRWLAAADPAATWDVAINTAVDGRWVGDPDGALGRLDQIGRCSISGQYPDCSATGIRRVDWSRPVTFEIDWVRVDALA